MAQLHKFMASLTDTRWKMDGKTVLYIPHEGTVVPVSPTTAKNKELIHRLESTTRMTSANRCDDDCAILLLIFGTFLRVITGHNLWRYCLTRLISTGNIALSSNSHCYPPVYTLCQD